MYIDNGCETSQQQLHKNKQKTPLHMQSEWKTYTTPRDDGLSVHAKKRKIGKLRPSCAFHDMVAHKQVIKSNAKWTTGRESAIAAPQQNKLCWMYSTEYYWDYYIYFFYFTMYFGFSVVSGREERVLRILRTLPYQVRIRVPVLLYYCSSLATGRVIPTYVRPST